MTRSRTEAAAGWSDAELVARIREHMHGCADCDEAKAVAQELINRMAQIAARCRTQDADRTALEEIQEACEAVPTIVARKVLRIIEARRVA